MPPLYCTENTGFLHNVFWCYSKSITQGKFIRRRRFHWHGIRMWVTKWIPHMKKKNHGISSKWEHTAAAHKQRAGLYSPQWIRMRWKERCLGLWVIRMGGPMVGDVSDSQCVLMMLSAGQGMELLFQDSPHSGGYWWDESSWPSYITWY